MFSILYVTYTLILLFNLFNNVQSIENHVNQYSPCVKVSNDLNVEIIFSFGTCLKNPKLLSIWQNLDTKTSAKLIKELSEYVKTLKVGFLRHRTDPGYKCSAYGALSTGTEPKTCLLPDYFRPNITTDSKWTYEITDKSLTCSNSNPKGLSLVSLYEYLSSRRVTFSNNTPSTQKIIFLVSDKAPGYTEEEFNKENRTIINLKDVTRVINDYDAHLAVYTTEEAADEWLIALSKLNIRYWGLYTTKDTFLSSAINSIVNPNCLGGKSKYTFYSAINPQQNALQPSHYDFLQKHHQIITLNFDIDKEYQLENRYAQHVMEISYLFITTILYKYSNVMVAIKSQSKEYLQKILYHYNTRPEKKARQSPIRAFDNLTYIVFLSYDLYIYKNYALNYYQPVNHEITVFKRKVFAADNKIGYSRMTSELISQYNAINFRHINETDYFFDKYSYIDVIGRTLNAVDDSIVKIYDATIDYVGKDNNYTKMQLQKKKLVDKNIQIVMFVPARADGVILNNFEEFVAKPMNNFKNTLDPLLSGTAKINLKFFRYSTEASTNMINIADECSRPIYNLYPIPGPRTTRDIQGKIFPLNGPLVDTNLAFIESISCLPFMNLDKNYYTMIYVVLYGPPNHTSNLQLMNNIEDANNSVAHNKNLSIGTLINRFDQQLNTLTNKKVVLLVSPLYYIQWKFLFQKAYFDVQVLDEKYSLSSTVIKYLQA